MEFDPERHELAALTPRFPRGRCRVLEIGCGNGRLTRRYANCVTSVLAIDSDQAAIAAFRAAGIAPHVEVRSAGVDVLELAPASIDVALFSWSL